jgi:glyoxylase-like metal-dependent hydrolase (beta-lactamase superfamily II)
MAPSRITLEPHGVAVVDAEYVRHGYAAVHVLQRGGRVAIIDTGANASVPLVLAALDELALPRAAVDFVFVTHAHLDHAGGAGLLLRELPGARAVAHPRAAGHLIDPSRLVEASRAVYGAERFERLYGEPLPIDAQRVLETADGDSLRLGSSELGVLHTPGHALHHHVLVDPEARAVFTGDTFGLSYRALDTEQGACVLPTTSPTQFDPEQLKGSIRRIAALSPEALYLTHFGRVTGVPRLAVSLERQIEAYERVAAEHARARDRFTAIRADLRALALEVLRESGAPLAALDDLLAADLDLNAQGLVAWLERSERAPR